MSREIKFRVWDKIEKRFITPTSFGQTHYNLTLNGKLYNLQNGSGGDDYVVQQFTGLKDKNGKEIYEGDLIKEINYGPYRVFWDNEIGGWCSCCYCDSELISEYVAIKIVGNIFDGTKYEGVQ